MRLLTQACACVVATLRNEAGRVPSRPQQSILQPTARRPIPPGVSHNTLRVRLATSTRSNGEVV
jgi:hypothetical protein